jgi:hypothetical protein
MYLLRVLRRTFGVRLPLILLLLTLICYIRRCFSDTDRTAKILLATRSQTHPSATYGAIYIGMNLISDSGSNVLQLKAVESSHRSKSDRYPKSATDTLSRLVPSWN